MVSACQNDAQHQTVPQRLDLAAAMQLARCAKADVDYIGKFHLMKAFQSMFCFENSTIPMGNEFSDFTNYFVQKAIPWIAKLIAHGDCRVFKAKH